jgi:hypothetical protein
MPHKGDFTMLGPNQSPLDSPQDMPPEDNQQLPLEGVGDEHVDDPATQLLQPDQIRLMGKYRFIHH